MKSMRTHRLLNFACSSLSRRMSAAHPKGTTTEASGNLSPCTNSYGVAHTPGTEKKVAVILLIKAAALIAWTHMNKGAPA
jgi:hypothetical protein